MNLIKHILYCLFYPIELFLRFWFPYAFRDDPHNPEPQTKEERKARSEKKKQDRNNQRKESKAVNQRRENFKERKQFKKDPSSVSVSNHATYNPQKSQENTEAINEDVLSKINNLKQNTKPKKPKQLGLHMVDIESPLSNKLAFDLMKEAESQSAFYWHDETSHQVAVKFEKGSLKKEYGIRDDVERKKLKPLIHPLQKENVDRTHVIPIGYHGSESDKRLLVGFSSKLNRKDMKNFEDKVAEKNKSKTVLWFVDIRKQADTSVKWFATVWSENGDTLFEKVFHDKRKFEWKARRF
ncbi:hypothetical protein [Staphylococcus capitis]|uniref:Uncharacterized protein n=1 Tax=Staphylococcus capitis TaxID=29388 RepID=A0ABX1SSC5_STACP|nr:hypothetical protein [Staphylococcus capitis]NMK53969.1 hypothetical protein [Staphylococcus capitis]NMK69338.1 hypothetical protein [Staphylococcus capitis]